MRDVATLGSEKPRTVHKKLGIKMELDADDNFLKRTDLLSLKKLVVDEIKNEFT